MKNPSFYYQNNVAASLIFINAVINYSSESHFIFSSSAAVYKVKKDLIAEQDEKIPLNIW
jgi:UDP-glucose 4-epimerase